MPISDKRNTEDLQSAWPIIFSVRPMILVVFFKSSVFSKVSVYRIRLNNINCLKQFIEKNDKFFTTSETVSTTLTAYAKRKINFDLKSPSIFSSGLKRCLINKSER